MNIKTRLNRLLKGQSQGKQTLNDLLSSKNQKNPVHDDDEMTAEISSQTSSEGNSCEAYPEQQQLYQPIEDEVDPYADVRDKLETLATTERDFYVHGLGEPTENRADASEIPHFVAYVVYMSFACFIIFGHIQDLLAVLIGERHPISRTQYPADNTKRYAPLVKSWENFFTRRMYLRVRECFNRAIGSNPGAHIDVLEQVSRNERKSLEVLGSIDNLDTEEQKESYRRGKYFKELENGTVARHCLNLGSYNYLGFADDWQATCASEVKGSMEKLPITLSSNRNDAGTCYIHQQLEETMATFLKKDDAIVLSMGFNTNATVIPSLFGPGDLIISDELNHTSIVSGARASKASIRVFKHNDMDSLESTLRDSIIKGRPRTRRPWNKIVVIVEGIYSMEGEYCDLRNVVRLSKEYGAYVYLDEAHSIGAMGATGRGCTEYCGVDTKDVDILMGTFTKSFGGMGGYIAADKDVIAHIRHACAGSNLHTSLSPVTTQQVLTALNVST